MRHHRLSYANVAATLALILAVTGGAYAAGVLPKNSVGSAQIKPGAVKTSDLGNGAVTGAKVKNGSLGTADFKAGTLLTGPKGDQGIQGIKGDKGERGDPGAPGVAVTRIPEVTIANPTATVSPLTALPGLGDLTFGDCSSNVGPTYTADVTFTNTTDHAVAVLDPQSPGRISPGATITFTGSSFTAPSNFRGMDLVSLGTDGAWARLVLLFKNDAANCRVAGEWLTYAAPSG